MLVSGMITEGDRFKYFWSSYHSKYEISKICSSVSDRNKFSGVQPGTPNYVGGLIKCYS